jgi:hypothetical protein
MELCHLQHLGDRWTAPLPRWLDSSNTLVLAFGAPERKASSAALRELADTFPQSVVMGCSTSGEIDGVQVHDGSISVAIARFDHTQLRRASTPIAFADDSYAAGSRLAMLLTADPHSTPLRAVFILSDGLSVNGTPLVQGLSDGLPPGVVITGGLAGDGSRFGQTWVLQDDGAPEAGHISAVALYGERLRVGHGCDAGWSDFGPERRITRSQGSVLFELDGKPALQLYKAYLGERANELPGAALLFPLSVRRSSADSESLVRTILAVDEERQSLTFAGDMPEGGIARLMRANTDKLITSAGLAAQQAAQGLPEGAPTLVISVSCVGRRLVLGERTDEEVETVVDAMPAGAAHVGFYSYGEISPAVPGGSASLHNQTMTVTALAEA